MFFLPFPLLDNRKVGGGSCLTQHLQTKNTNQYNSRLCHRITELATLLGNIIKVGFTLGSRSFLNYFLCLFDCFIFKGTVWVAIDPTPGFGETF